MDGLGSRDHRKIINYLRLALYLIGGFEAKPVDEEDLVLAQHLLTYVVDLVRSICCDLSVTPTLHSLLHIVEDCRHFECQLDNLSAFPFENFMGFFRNTVRCATFKLQQIINAINDAERLLYATNRAGEIIFDTDGNPVKQGAGFFYRTDNISPTVVKSRRYSKYVASGFTLKNKVQDQWCILKDENGICSIVCCRSFTKDALIPGSEKVRGKRAIIVTKHTSFVGSRPNLPGDSRQHGVYKFKGLHNIEETWPTRCIVSKLFVMPDMSELEKNFPDKNHDFFDPSTLEANFGKQYMENEFPWVGVVLRHLQS
jgi:hypothetical protein